MSEMKSLFSQLRASRIAAMNEGTEDTNKDNLLNEGTETKETETPVVEETTTAEETPVTETPAAEEESVNEEVSAVFCSACGALVSGYMNESELDECPCCGSEELVEKVVKVVRDGEVVKKKVRTGAKPRLSAAQKAALAKARKKAHTAGANKKRAKSMKKGAKAGLHEEDEIECSECGYTGEYDDFSLDNDGNLICPDCGAVIHVNESAGTTDEGKTEETTTPTTDTVNENEADTAKADMKALLESVNAPKFVHDALDEGKEAFVTGYLNLKMKK